MAKTNSTNNQNIDKTVERQGQAGGKAPHSCRGRQCSSQTSQMGTQDSTKTKKTQKSASAGNSKTKNRDNQDMILEIFLDDIE